MNDEVEERPEEPDDDRLKLPRGAFIAFRQSGGFHFSTREVIVYHDGHVTSRRQGKVGAGKGARRITPDEVADLKEMITLSGLFDLPRFAPIGRPNPDGYAYELIARLGRRSNAIEFFDDSIPTDVENLLAQLKTLFTLDDASLGDASSSDASSE